MVLIRPAVQADIPRLVRFNQALAHETEGHRLDASILEPGIRKLMDDAILGFYTVAAAEADPATPIGCTMITYEWSDWRDGLIWWIQSVYVDPAWRGQGVFRRLLEHLEDQARQDPGIRGLRLYVEDENDRAHRTYDKLGLLPARYSVRQKLF